MLNAQGVEDPDIDDIAHEAESGRVANDEIVEGKPGTVK
jgi:hypothetical protein